MDSICTENSSGAAIPDGDDYVNEFVAESVVWIASPE